MEVAREHDLRPDGRAAIRVGPVGTETFEPPDAVLYAVLDDIRNTLGVAWLDPIFRTIATDSLFVIAAWAATRPNITKSFSESAAQLRRTATDHVQRTLDPPDHLPIVEERLRPEDADRLIRTVRALHQGLPKVYLVVQSWARLARRQRIPGTGREEVPARRGIPPWQDGVLVPGSAAPNTKELLEETAKRLEVPLIPSSLFALGPAPAYLAEACEDILARASTPAWSSGVISLRKCVTTGIECFPHPMELQWDALAARGLTEERREFLVEELRDAAAVMPVAVLCASFLCAALGGPDTTTDF